MRILRAFSLHLYRDTIWDIRMEAFQRDLLDQWSQFTIWNAGKQGRKFYRSLAPENQRKVGDYVIADVP